MRGPEARGRVAGVRTDRGRGALPLLALGAPPGLALCALLALGCAGSVAADKLCQRPLAPDVPQAESASNVDMIGARVRIELYLEAANTFLACLNDAETKVGSTAREVKLDRIAKKRTEVEEEIKTVTEQYNEQVRLYRSLNGASEDGSSEGSTAR